MSYNDLSGPERAAVRAQFYDPETTDERRTELLRLMQNSADEVKMGRQCPRCKHYPYFAPHDKALLEGHVYSQAGMDELPITGYCEFCFDLITKEPDEEPDEEPDAECGAPTDWPGRPCGLFGGHPGQHYPAPTEEEKFDA